MFNRDTDIARYIQGTNGQVHLQLYNSTVGFPDGSGWHLRDTSLVAVDTANTLMPARMPISVTIAQNLTASTAATLTAEDGVTLSVGLASVNGIGPAAASGQANGDTITYPGVLPSALSPNDGVFARVMASDAPTSTVPATPASTVVISPTPTVPITPTTVPVTATVVPATSTSTVTTTPTSTPPATPTSTAPLTPTATVVMTPTSVVPFAPTTGSVGAADFALRSTVSGLDLRLTLRDARLQGPLAFALTLDPRLDAVQEAGNVIEVTRTITDYDHNGNPQHVTGPDFLLEAPAVHDNSADPAAPTGPVTMSLLPGSSDHRNVVLAIDPSWLQDSHRVFPIRVDLPIETGFSASDTGLLGTVNSCSPAVPAPLADVVVGTEGNCILHGQAYFDVKSLVPSATVVSATLNMYTPNHSGATGVELYPNAPIAEPSLHLHYVQVPFNVAAFKKQLPADFRKLVGPHFQYPTWRLAPDTVIPPRWMPPTLREPTSWQPPSWESAPMVMTGSVGIAQSASTGHWQRWDVTTLVRQWVKDRGTNDGLTLEGDGTPITFASPLGAGSADATTAPYLDIVYAQAPTGLINDGASSPFGVSETYFGPDDAGASCTTNITCQSFGLGCPNNICNNTSISYTFTNPSWGLAGAAKYIRFGVNLQCTTSLPSWTTWTPYLEELENAYHYKLVPIVDFLYPPSGCADNPLVWWNNIFSFLVGIWKAQTPGILGLYPVPKPVPWTYYEIGNEENYDPMYAPNNWVNYANDFANAAQAINGFFSFSTNRNWKVMPSGVLNPTADEGQYGTWCYDQPTGTANVFTFESFPIAVAESPPFNINGIYALAAHPYHYTTSNATAWTEYYYYGNTYPGPADCGDVQHMLQVWQGQNLPIFFTEDNWDTAPNTPDGNTCTPEVDYDSCELTYMADLFSWLTDNGYNSANSSLRVMIYRGNDADRLLGLYGRQGNLLQGLMPAYDCPNDSGLGNNYWYLFTIYDLFSVWHQTCH